MNARIHIQILTIETRQATNMRTIPNVINSFGTGTVFWASWIRIQTHNLFLRIRIQILPSTSKKKEEKL
jgi:hypothetical protein